MRSIYVLLLAALLVTIVMLLPVATNTDVVVTFQQQAYTVDGKTLNLRQSLERLIPVGVYRSLTQEGTPYHGLSITWVVTTKIMVGVFLIQRVRDFADGV